MTRVLFRQPLLAGGDRMGYVVKTPAGNFRANWRDPAGKQKAKTFKTKKEANAYLADTTSTINQGGYVDPRAGRVRFRTFAARWESARTVEARTAERTASVLRAHLLPQWGNWPIGKIDHMAVQQWVTDVGRTRAPATVTKCLTTMRMILRAAVRSRLIANNPTDGIRVAARRQSEVEPEPLTRDAFFRQLLPAVPLQHRAIVCAAAGAGLRWGECAGLSWGAVDLDAGRLRVGQVAVETPGSVTLRPFPKSAAGVRTVPIPDFLAVALQARRLAAGGDPDPRALVFAGPTGSPPRRANFRKRVWLPSLVRAKLSGVRFHDLRHCYATWLVTDGVPLNVVQRVMGHTRASFTLARYTHAPVDFDDRVRDVFQTPADFSLTFDLQTEHLDTDNELPDDE
jgi:integrase